MVSLVYSGTDNAAQRTKIETFVHQVHAFRNGKTPGRSVRPQPLLSEA